MVSAFSHIPIECSNDAYALSKLGGLKENLTTSTKNIKKEKWILQLYGKEMRPCAYWFDKRKIISNKESEENRG